MGEHGDRQGRHYHTRKRAIGVVYSSGDPGGRHAHGAVAMPNSSDFRKALRLVRKSFTNLRKCCNLVTMQLCGASLYFGIITHSFFRRDRLHLQQGTGSKVSCKLLVGAITAREKMYWRLSGVAGKVGSSMNVNMMDLLKQQKNRGYVIAGGAAIIAFIAFFLPYVTASYLGVSASASGTSGGWLWFEEIGALVAIAVAAVLIFRNNAFGLTNMPVEKQVKYGRIALLAAGIVALLIHLLFLLGYQSQVGGGLGSITTGFSIGLGFGWFLFLLASIGM